MDGAASIDDDLDVRDETNSRLDCERIPVSGVDASQTLPTSRGRKLDAPTDCGNECIESGGSEPLTCRSGMFSTDA